MASLWRQKSGMRCVTYRELGLQRVCSLRTRDRREALKLERAIETVGSVLLARPIRNRS
jgi:hypothetical protein